MALARDKGRLGVWFELCLVCCIAWVRPAQAAERTAFHYGSHVPSELLSAYDQVVVEPDHLASLKPFAEHRARALAYLSVGEVAQKSERARAIDAAWVLAENRAWSSWVMDLEHPGYQAYLMRRFEELWAKGYRGFFLDTLDSYRLAAPQRDAGLRNALVKIIRELGRRHPDARLLVNRGFEVLSDVRGQVSGVVAESLFDRWDASTQSYQRVPEADRRWLAAELTRARDQLGLPVTVIDYRPPREKLEARETARKIAALGFEPWVANATLDDLGIGQLEILPRRVLILTNDVGAAVPDAVRFLAPVLEYLGYVPEHRPVPGAWSDLAALDGYQGVITWFGSAPLPPGYLEWMNAERQRGRRFVLFGVPGFDVAAPEARELGLELVAASSASASRVVARDALVGFEAQPPARPFDGPLWKPARGSDAVVHLSLADTQGRLGVAVATTRWGGLALSHVLALRGLSGERAWVIDPFEFLRRSLALPDAPMPNVTSYAGRRLAMIAVRPEGSAALAGHGQPSNAAALASWLVGERAWPHSLATSASDPAAKVSAADAAAAASLLELGCFERAELRPGATLARGAGSSLTQVTGMFSGRDPVGPIALDSLFLGSGEAQAYPFRDLLSTLIYTGAPRRLKPVFVDYHGYLIGNPGGRAALGAIYAWLAQAQLFPAFVSEYTALAHAFREQVVARSLDGSFEIFGGAPLLTVRSPRGLGLPSGAGPVVVRAEPDGIYSSFLPGRPRRVSFAGERLETPHIVQTNGHVLAFAALPAQAAAQATGEAPVLALELELGGHMPLELELGGLPRGALCKLEYGRSSSRGVSSEAGALRLSLGVEHTGKARLECRAETNNG
jgi:hypothetical protein